VRSLDARWFAERATAAAWAEALVIQPAFEDVHAALDAGDWATCVDCCFETVLGACFVLAVLDGYNGAPVEADLLVRCLVDGSPAADLLGRLPHGHEARGEDAREAVAISGEALALVEAALPLRVERFRTPEGFFPGVRAAAGLEKLRTRLGLPGFGWRHFTT
jgi:hypothetical protein